MGFQLHYLINFDWEGFCVERSGKFSEENRNLRVSVRAENMPARKEITPQISERIADLHAFSRIRVPPNRH